MKRLRSRGGFENQSGLDALEWIAVAAVFVVIIIFVVIFFF
jgi:hypothetical protein